MVRPHRSTAAAALLGSFCVAGAASAQSIEYRAIVAAGIQVTDNVQFVPMNGPTGAEGPRAAFIGNVNPAFVLSYETPRWLHELRYTLNFASVLGVGQQYNVTQQLGATSRYEVSLLTEANFAVRVGQGVQTFFPEPEAGEPTRFVRSGTTTFANAELMQGVNRRLSEQTVFAEQATATLFYPLASDPPRPAVYGLNVQLGLTYNDDPDTYAVNLASQLAVTGEIECYEDGQCGGGRVCAVATGRCEVPTSAAAALQQLIAAQVNAPQLATRLGANHRHDFKNGFLTDLEAGVQQVLRLTDGGGQFWQPVGRIGVRYTREDIAALALNLTYGTQLDPAVGGLVSVYNSELNAAIPLDPQTKLFALQLQVGYQYGTTVDPVGAVLPGFQLIAGDAALTYRPGRWLPNLVGALRYQFRYQITDPTPDGSTQLVTLLSMRNAVMLNLGFEYPERKQGL